MDDSYNGQNDTLVSVYLGSELQGTDITDTDGNYEYYIHNISEGSHNVTVNSSASSQILTFTVVEAAQIPTYKIIASSLVVSKSKPQVNFTVKKYLGTTLSNESYNYDVFYENGSLFTNSSGVMAPLS